MPEHEPGPNGHVSIVSAQRTPIGEFGGALAGTPAVELGGLATLCLGGGGSVAMAFERV